MCNLSQGIEDRGIEKGIVKGREEGREEGRKEMLLELVQRLMESLKCPADRAMNLLKVPETYREEFKQLLNTQ